MSRTERKSTSGNPASVALRAGEAGSTGVPQQALLEFLTARHEPDVSPAVRFTHEVPQRGALVQVPGDVAEDGQTELVGDELLNDGSGDARFEPEEIVVEPLRRNDDQARSMPPPPPRSAR
jgi:hypothetical protein